MPDQDDKCYACGRAFKARRRIAAFTEDGSLVYVGTDCYRTINRMKAVGWRGPQNGPYLYPPRSLAEYEQANLLRT